jgi:hypothetical protein
MTLADGMQRRFHLRRPERTRAKDEVIIRSLTLRSAVVVRLECVPVPLTFWLTD